MHPRTRMFKTLGWLAVAMTGSAWLLAWLEPRDPAVAVLTDPEFLRRQAVEAVKTDQGVAWAPWRDIEIVAAVGDSPGSTTLAATRCLRHHFLVSEWGLVHAGPAWRHQQFVEGRDSPIVVGMAGITDRDDIRLAQWMGLRTLLVVLRERIPPFRGGLSVQIRHALGVESPQVARSLRELLGIEGFTVSSR